MFLRLCADLHLQRPDAHFSCTAIFSTAIFGPRGFVLMLVFTYDMSMLMLMFAFTYRVHFSRASWVSFSTSKPHESRGRMCSLGGRSLQLFHVIVHALLHCYCAVLSLTLSFCHMQYVPTALAARCSSAQASPGGVEPQQTPCHWRRFRPWVPRLHFHIAFPTSSIRVSYHCRFSLHRTH